MQVDLDEALGELKFSEDRVRKATSDSGALAELWEDARHKYKNGDTNYRCNKTLLKCPGSITISTEMHIIKKVEHSYKKAS